MSIAPVPWRQFVAEVLCLYAPPIRRAATFRKMRQVVLEFSPHCRTTGDMGPQAIAGWIASHPYRANTTRFALLRTMRAACSYGASAGYLADPFAYRSPREWLPSSAIILPETPFPRHRSEAEVVKILDQADLEAQDRRWEALRLRRALYAWLYTGARSREITGSTMADWDLVNMVFHIRSNPLRDLKTAGSAAKLPIPPRLAAVIAETDLDSAWFLSTKNRRKPWLNGPVGGKALDEVAALGRRAGVQGLTILALRHSFGTLSEGWEWGPKTLQRQLRHTSIQTQIGYCHEDLDQMRRAASKIRYDGAH